MIRHKAFKAIALAAAALAAVAPTVAAGVDPIKARIEAYRELGAAFKNVNDELRSGTPQTYVLQLSARQISAVAKAQYGFFPKGSGPRPGVKTAAKPEIWSQPAKFKAAQNAFAKQAKLFDAAVKTGDVAAIGAGAKALGPTCGACHKAFRTEKP